MSFSDIRAQLVANTTFLYGPSIEILTLYNESSHEYQTVAVKYDPLTASWTKYLHSGTASSMSCALLNLLTQSGIEIMKKFHESVTSFPISGENNEVVRGLVLQRRESTPSEEFEFVATPMMSISETERGEAEEEERPREPDVDECYPVECEEPAEELHDDPVDELYEEPEELCGEPVEELCRESVEEVYGELVEKLDAPSEEPAPPLEFYYPEEVKEEKQVVPCEPEPTKCYPVEDEKAEEEPYFPEAEPEPAPEPEQACSASDDVWATWGISKKKKRKTSWIDQPSTLEPEPKVAEPTSEPCEEAIDVWAMWGLSKKHSKKSSREIVEVPVVEETPAVFSPEPEPEYSPPVSDPVPEPVPEPEPVAEEIFGWPSSTSKKVKSKNKSRKFIDEPKIEEPPVVEKDISFVGECTAVEVCTAVEPVPEIDSDALGSFLTKKKKKYNKGKRAIFEEPEDCPPPKECAPEEYHVEERQTVEPVPEVESDIWGSFSNKKKKGKRGTRVVFEEYSPEECHVEERQTIEPVPEVESDIWGSCYNKKKKEKRVKRMIVEEPLAVEDSPAPEPEPEIDSLGWGSFGTKNDNRGNQVIVEEPLAVEDSPAPEPEPEIDSLGWVSLAPKNDNRENKVTIEEAEYCPPTEDCAPEECPAEECPADELAPEVESDGWGSFMTKKDRKWKRTIADEPEDSLSPKKSPIIFESLNLEPILGHDFSFTLPAGQASLSGKTITSKGSLPRYTVTENSIREETIKESAPPFQVSEESTKNTPLPPAPEANSPTHHSLPPAGQTVVLKILHSSQINTKTLGAMVTLTENSHRGIFAAVDRYIDSKKYSPARQTRAFEIKYGAGRNGELLELAALNEEMWPDYLEYFRKCTGFPELTVEVVDS